MANNPDIDRLHELHAQLIGLGRRAVQATKAQKAKLAAIDARWDLPDAQKREGKAREWAQFENAATTANLDRLSLEAERQRLVAKLTAGHRQPGGTDEELRRQAAWSRLEKQLDLVPAESIKFSAALSILEAAAASGDEATLQAARRELPAYLERNKERLPRESAVWLDMNGGPPETVAARVVEMADGKDRAASAIAVRWMQDAARTREVPEFMPDPNGREGERVTWLTGDES